MESEAGMKTVPGSEDLEKFRRWMECVIHPRQDKGIKEINSETSFSASGKHLSWWKAYRNSKIRDEVHDDADFLLILLSQMELELILLLRMDCYGRSYSDSRVGYKKDVLLLCIMCCTTTWVHQFHTSPKCTISRNKTYILIRWQCM